MDKIKSILASASGRKTGPPVPPRPSPAAVQKALEKTRHKSPTLQNFTQISAPPIVHGRTVVFNSISIINNEHVGHQAQPNNVSCEIKCFDTKTDDSPTGFTRKLVQNGNSAQSSVGDVNIDKTKSVNENKVANSETPRVILHHKSPVPRPRSKPDTNPVKEKSPQPKVSKVLINSPVAQSRVTNLQQNYCASLLMRNQNSQSYKITEKIRGNIKERDDELKEKLLNEMLNRSNTLQACNRHVKYNGSNLKRASSFDVLNESLGEKSSDKKVIFHELLISELSEMRRESRLSSAKSSPDISPNGDLNIFEIDDKSLTRNKFLSLEDSGVEDEGKTDDCSSSGVGDSWDSCKEMENR